MNLVSFFLSRVSTILLTSFPRYHAYLDPGSGSYFIQLLLASLMGALFVIGIYRKKVTDFFRKLFSKRESDDDLDE